MAYEHKDVIIAQAQQIAADRAQAVGSYESARISEDPDATMLAANAIIEADARLAALNRIANNLVASQRQAPQGNKYGLRRDEIEVAHGLASGDRKLTNDDRERIYAENRQRYRGMRAAGYRDELDAQGRR